MLKAAFASLWSVCPQCSQTYFLPFGGFLSPQREQFCDVYAGLTIATRMSFLNSAGILSPPSTNLTCLPWSPQTGRTMLETVTHFGLRWYLLDERFGYDTRDFWVILRRGTLAQIEHTRQAVRPNPNQTRKTLNPRASMI